MSQKNVSVYIGDSKSPIARSIEVLARANDCAESELLKVGFKEYCESNKLYDSSKEKWNVKRIEALEKKFPKKKGGKLRQFKFEDED